MIIDQIEYINKDFEEDLLERLRGNIFHLTTKRAFELIKEKGFVYHNKNNEFALNPMSEKSFGRNRGWVCLFDLRKQSREIIDETLIKYNFLRPSWFIRHEPEFTELNLAYLFVHPRVYNRIIPNDTANKVWLETNKYEHYVPKAECWYPSNMPLECVGKVLLVRIYENAPKDNPFLYAHHLIAVEEERVKNRG